MKKIHPIKFDVSEEEFQKIKKKAEALSQTVAGYCRMVSLGSNIKIESN